MQKIHETSESILGQVTKREQKLSETEEKEPEGE